MKRLAAVLAAFAVAAPLMTSSAFAADTNGQTAFTCGSATAATPTQVVYAAPSVTPVGKTQSKVSYMVMWSSSQTKGSYVMLSANYGKNYSMNKTMKINTADQRSGTRTFSFTTPNAALKFISLDAYVKLGKTADRCKRASM